MGIGYYLTTGFSTVSLPICANMEQYLSGSTTLSGVALDWNEDLSIGKIAVHIPIDSAYVFDGQLINIGYTSANPPTIESFENLGYFNTRTSATIELCGEWQPLTYLPTMYQKQYKYFMEPNNIYAYTNSTIIGLCGDVSVSAGLDFGPLASWPTGSGYVQLGKFDLRVFYDQVKYTPTIVPTDPTFSYIVAGYQAGWNHGDIDQFVYATDTISHLINELPEQVWHGGMVGDTTNYMYYAKGSHTTPAATNVDLYKISQSTGASTSIYSSMRAQAAPFATTDTNYTYGYWIDYSINTSEKMSINTNTVTQLNSYYISKYGGCTGKDSTKGYSVGSDGVSYTDKTVWTLLYATETLTNLGTVASLPSYATCAVCSMYTDTKCYLAFNADSGVYTNAFIYTYTTNTAAVRSGAVNGAVLRYWNGGICSATHGYTIGGLYGGYYSGIHKFSIADDTAAYSVAANTTVAKEAPVAFNSYL